MYNLGTNMYILGVNKYKNSLSKKISVLTGRKSMNIIIKYVSKSQAKPIIILCHSHVQTRVNQRQSFNIPSLLCLKTANIPQTVHSIRAQARSVNRTSPGVWL